MFVKEWSEKLTSDAKRQFMRSPFWTRAEQRGLGWEKAILHKMSVQEAVDQMDEASSAVLRAFYICFGAGPVSEERLFSLREGLSGAEFRYGLIRLQNAGIVFALRQGWGDRLYAIPSDCFFLWHSVLFPSLNKLSAASDGAGRWEQRQDEMAGKPLGRRLLAAWAELARAGLGLTAKGTLPKKTISRLRQALALTDEEMVEAGWQPDPSEPYSPAVSFTLKLSMQLGVVEDEGNRLKWRGNKLAEWLSGPDLLQEALLLQWSLNELLEKKPAMWHIIAVLTRMEPGIWYSEDVILEQIRHPEIKGLECGDSLDSCLKLLRAFGWFELARASDTKMLRWTIMPLLVYQEQPPDLRPESIMIEPNGDLLVPPGCPSSVRWELELIADRKSDDQLSVWQLTRFSIGRALAHGRSIPSIVQFLRAASGEAPISPLLQSSLSDWGKQETGDGKPLTDRYPELPLDHQTAEDFSELRIRSSKRTFAGCELMNHEDFRIERFLPELERVPIKWMQQLRSYHHSTCLEIMERALSWQAPVQLSMDDAVVSFVPARLEKKEGGWAVTGLLRETMTNREVCLTPEMWQGMKLVAPGVGGFA